MSKVTRSSSVDIATLFQVTNDGGSDFSEVRGQEHIKRARDGNGTVDATS